jgi:hypothetical protein
MGTPDLRHTRAVVKILPPCRRQSRTAEGTLERTAFQGAASAAFHGPPPDGSGPGTERSPRCRRPPWPSCPGVTRPSAAEPAGPAESAAQVGGSPGRGEIGPGAGRASRSRRLRNPSAHSGAVPAAGPPKGPGPYCRRRMWRKRALEEARLLIDSAVNAGAFAASASPPPFLLNRVFPLQRLDGNGYFTWEATKSSTAARASSSFSRSLPPPMAESGLPPPEPPAMPETSFTSSPAFTPRFTASAAAHGQEGDLLLAGHRQHGHAVGLLVPQEVAHLAQGVDVHACSVLVTTFSPATS